jgi:hypothetical protein
MSHMACDPSSDVQGNRKSTKNASLSCVSAYSLIRGVPPIHHNLRHRSVGVVLVVFCKGV